MWETEVTSFIILTSVFILLWGSWVSQTWMRSHKVSDRVKTRTKLFSLLRKSSIQETSLYILKDLLIRAKRNKWEWMKKKHQYIKMIFWWNQDIRWKLPWPTSPLKISQLDTLLEAPRLLLNKSHTASCFTRSVGKMCCFFRRAQVKDLAYI